VAKFCPYSAHSFEQIEAPEPVRQLGKIAVINEKTERFFLFVWIL
jgi:hypothetical protein